MPRHRDLEGQRFGRLVVQERISRTSATGYHIWKCLCDCGATKEVRTELLTSRRTQSCGCLARESIARNGRKNGLEAGVSAFNALVANYRRDAKARGATFALTETEARALFLAPCHYCGAEPGRVFRATTCRAAFVCNGIDRLDSSSGYVAGNVVPACKACNYLKGGRPYRVFMGLLARIAARHVDLFEELSGAKPDKAQLDGGKS
jgi:hypothetical protein